jgi:hypothetical protein
VLSSHGSVMVRVPVPERYAIHKLIVSQLRHKTSSKPEKDLRQAAVLIEALVERYPGAIEDAASAVPQSAARHLARAIKALEQHLLSRHRAHYSGIPQGLNEFHGVRSASP